MKVRVARIETLTPRVRRFTLVPERGLLPAVSAGSHIGLMLPGDRRNAYSLTSSPYQREVFQIAVQRDPASRGGSAFLHEEARAGDAFDITPPANQFPLDRLGARHLLIAGGIGITPFLAHVESLERWGAPFALHYHYRGEENAAFAPELRARLGERFRAIDTTRDSRSDLAALLAAQPVGTHVYVCGPAALIDAGLTTARALGWPRHQVHAERFGAPPQAPARAFRARLACTGRDVAVPAEDSLLDALLGAGVPVPYSCRIGGCGTCEVGVSAGDIDHRDHCWTDEDRAGDTRLLACISRARHDHLVLDL